MPNSIIFQDTLIIAASISVVRRFITEAQRIYDYYPLGFHYENLIENKQFACYGAMGASLLEVTTNHSELITLKVHNTFPTFKKNNAHTLIDMSFFSMVEDWHLFDENGHTRIIKTWRTLEQHKLRFIPASWLCTVIIFIAKREHSILIKRWNSAAKTQH